MNEHEATVHDPSSFGLAVVETREIGGLVWRIMFGFAMGDGNVKMY